VFPEWGSGRFGFDEGSFAVVATIGFVVIGSFGFLPALIIALVTEALNIRSVLAPGGKAIVLVPQGQWNFGTLDEVLGHQRRYSSETLHKLATDCGFKVQEMLPFNRVGTPAWWLNGKVLRRRVFGLGQIMALNALTPLFRRIDSLLPIQPLSLIAILERDDDDAPVKTAA